MDWKEKILQGMKLIREGCKEKGACCCECLYFKYCQNYYKSPDIEWEDIDYGLEKENP